MNENKFNYNHRIELQKEVQQEGEFGEINVSFETIKRVWANIKPITGNQNFSKMKQEVDITHYIETRYLKDGLNCKKIIFKNRTFNVISIICPDEKNEKLLFNVKEVL